MNSTIRSGLAAVFLAAIAVASSFPSSTAVSAATKPATKRSVRRPTTKPTAGRPTSTVASSSTGVPTTGVPPTTRMAASITGFSLTSSTMTAGGAYPTQFTCDGASTAPSLDWSGAPSGTTSYAVVMHHVPGPGDVHWYWVIYGIDPSVTHIEQGASLTGMLGTLGTNSVNERNAYAPPCSKGPGAKTYTFTVYALSKSPAFVFGTAVSRQVLLDAIASTTLGTATLAVTYSRPGTTTDGPPSTKASTPAPTPTNAP